MKKGLKITAAVLAVLVSAGCTTLYASTNNDIAADDTPAVEERSVVSVAETERKVSEAKAEKDETVYVLSDASGKVNRTIVTDWLKNSGAASSISDISDLKDIYNVKGDETFSEDGDSISWAANGSDIYYRGDSDKELPVQMKITYTLDGKEISPSELAGKSGHVVIRYDYTNTEKQTVDINGEETELYTPYMLATVTALDSGKFVNVQLSNGKVISDGSKVVVMGTAFPGLKESLGLADKDIDIPDYFEISADVTDFELETTVTVATSEVLSGFDVSDDADVSELNSSLTKLSDASEELCDGTKALYDGISQLSDGAGTLTDGIDSLADGTVSLKAGADQLYSGAGQLAEGAGSLNKGAQDLNDGITSAKAGSSQLVQGSEKLKAGADQLSGGLTSAGTGIDQLSGGLDSAAAALDKTAAADQQVLAGLKAMYNQNKSADIKAMIDALEQSTAGQQQVSAQLKDGGAIKDGVSTLKAGNAQLAKGAQELSAGVTSLHDGASSLDAGIGQLSSGSQQLAAGAQQVYGAASQVQSGAKQLSDGCTELNDGAKALREGGVTLTDGISDLKDGSKELDSGMNEFNETGIRKLTSALDGDLSGIVDRLKALKDIAADYGTFSGVSDDMSGNVKFIYTTESITKD